MDLSFNLIAFFLFLIFLSALIQRWKRSRAGHKLPPSPWKLPLIGHMHHLIGSSPSHRALRKLAQKHGPLMHLQLGEISSIVISSSRLAKEILKTHDLSFANRAEFLATKIGCYNGTDIAFSPYGDYWRQMRRICTMELLSTKTVRSFESIRQDEAMHLVKSIQALAGTGKTINLTEKLLSYTSSVVCRAAFGKVNKDHRNAFVKELQESIPIATSFDISDLFPSYKILHPLSQMKAKAMKTHQTLDKILENIVNVHIENLVRTKMGTGEFGHEDLVDVLLRVKGSGDLQFPITNDNIKAILIDMFSGGTETSATLTNWAMSEMIKKPNVMAKAQSEIRKAFLGKKTIEENDLQELKYLKLVIKETLRLHPPVPLLLPRECREQCEIDGYTIPVKTRVMINAWAISRDPMYWDDPEIFIPERFENHSIDFTGSYFEYIPFGSGRRMCPGISFGIANAELPLALLLYHFDWKLPDGLRAEDLDMSETVGVTVIRKNNLLLLATSYHPSQDM